MYLFIIFYLAIRPRIRYRFDGDRRAKDVGKVVGKISVVEMLPNLKSESVKSNILIEKQRKKGIACSLLKSLISHTSLTRNFQQLHTLAKRLVMQYL